MRYRIPLPAFWEDFLAPDADRFRPLTPLLPVDAFDMMMTLIAGRGDEIMPHDKERFFSDESGLYALGLLRAIYRLGPEEQVAMNPIRVLETMSSTDEFACSPCLFGYVNYVRPGFRAHRISYFDLPLCQGALRPRAILGGAGIGISASTDHPEEAISFARWLASPQIQGGVYLASNGQPASRHVWSEQATNPDTSGFFKGAFHTMENAWTRPRDAWFLDFVDDICEIMPDFFRKEIRPEAFLSRINMLYRHHLKEA